MGAEELVDTRPFELVRWGLKFTDPVTERAYSDWRIRDAVPFARMAAVAGLVSWLATIVTVAITTTYLESAALWIGLVALPPMVAVLVTTQRARLAPWMLPLSGISNATSGFTAIVLAYGVFDRPDIGVAATVLIAFFGFALARTQRPRIAIPSVFSYIAVGMYLAFSAYSEHRIDGMTLAFYVLLPTITFLTGIQVSLMTEQISRESYRQSRIIDAQRAVIDELQKAEVQRHVAARSQDLAGALAKLANQPQELAPARTIDGRYRVVRKLGAGGMGAVYEVERVTDGRRLAVKTLRGRGGAAALARLAREAQIAAEVDHPNLMSVLDIGIADDGLYIAMPLVAGGSLEAFRSQFGDAAWAKPIIGQIARGLAELHGRGIVHRDLKPANVLVDGGVARIADFGLASLGKDDNLTAAGSTFDALAPTEMSSGGGDALTQAGDVFGTPMYMAPELADGVADPKPASDIFALGVVAYELFTGKRPFSESPVHARLSGRKMELLDAPGVPALVMRCLDVDPAARPIASEIAAAFGLGNPVALEATLVPATSN